MQSGGSFLENAARLNLQIVNCGDLEHKFFDPFFKQSVLHEL
jgi:hypothetical protein